MKKFMDEDFLLTSDAAKKLYHDYAENMPIVDYHCHINPQEICEDRKFENITQVWLGGDHYKWRQLRSNGVDEKYFYMKDFEILDMSKRECAELKVNTTEMCKRIFNPDFKMSTLTCVSGGYQEKKVLDSGRPRKLTEVEYERLQGLPDNFTKIQLNNRWLSYSKRCSLMGNGWNEPTVEWILSGFKEKHNMKFAGMRN